METKIRIEVQKILVELDPEIEVFHVIVHRADGIWEESCHTEGELKMFIRGVKAGSLNYVDNPEIPEKPTRVII